MKRAFEVGMLWLAFPALLLPGAVSVSAGAAGGRFLDLGMIHPNFAYVFPTLFPMIVFASQVFNLTWVMRRWPNYPNRGIPWPAGLAQIGLYALLTLWAHHFTLESTTSAATPTQGPIDLIVWIAPVACAVLSVLVFSVLLARTSPGIPAAEGRVPVGTTVGAALFLTLGCAAVVGRFLIGGDATAENVANWVLVALGAPWSLAAAPVAWIGTLAATRLPDAVEQIVVASAFSIPVVANAVLVLRAAMSPATRLRLVPRLLLD